MMFRFLSYVFVSLCIVSTTLFAVGAGVLPIFDDGTVLIGKELRGRYNVYSDFGGKQDPFESPPETAWREFQEETGDSFPQVSFNQVAQSPSAAHHHRVGSYHMYFVHIPGPKPLISNIVANANDRIQRLGCRAHVEKTEWRYVDANQLQTAAVQYANVPGTNEQMFGPFGAILRNPATLFPPLPVQAANPGTRDLVIKKSLPAHKKQDLFNNLVNNKISGKTRPDNYHVTLGWVRDVAPLDRPLLEQYLQNAITAPLQQATFTARSVNRYLVNRPNMACPLVLQPTAAEENNLKGINGILYNALAAYNVQNGKNYQFHNDVMPRTFVPHITLCDTFHIHKWGLNRDNIINSLNSQIGTRHALEFLQNTVNIAPRAPAPQIAAVKRPASRKVVLKRRSAPRKATKARARVSRKGARTRNSASRRTVRSRRHAPRKHRK